LPGAGLKTLTSTTFAITIYPPRVFKAPCFKLLRVNNKSHPLDSKGMAITFHC
jgi:hypothetical protein